MLLTRNGIRLDRRGAARIVARVARAAGVTKRITPHSLRHTFVTMTLDAGQAERDIAISRGHSDTRMVAYYDRGRDNISRNSTHAGIGLDRGHHLIRADAGLSLSGQ
jgi:integrase/recombinase XerD